MARLFIEISGGVVQQVYSDVVDLQVMKIDWDVTDDPGEEVQVNVFSTVPVRLMPAETAAAVANSYETLRA